MEPKGEKEKKWRRDLDKRGRSRRWIFEREEEGGAGAKGNGEEIWMREEERKRKK